MTVEERLKDLVIKQYGTMKDFTAAVGIPNSTFANILKRGVQNANVLTIIKICQALNISTDALAEGKIVPASTPEAPPTKIEDLFDTLKQQLLNADNLTLADAPVQHDDLMYLVSALDVTLRITAYKQELQHHD